MPNHNTVHPITAGLLDGSLDLSNITLEQFRAGRIIYQTLKEAQKKGFEAHHIVPIAEQLEKTEFSNRKEFLKKADHIDDRCIRYTTFEHIIDHYLMAKENDKYILIFEIMTRQSYISLLEDEKSILDKCLSFSKYRESGIQKLIDLNMGNSYHLGHKHSEEAKKKMSERAKARHIPCSEEKRRKISESHKGIGHTEETRKKLSESHKGKEPWNKGMKGQCSAETCRKISEANKGRKVAPEVLEKRKERYALMKQRYYSLKESGYTGNWNDFQGDLKNNRIQLAE